jgi:hypothetical protein
MSGRLWYPQLDVYDSIRRIGGLLVFWPLASPPSVERLCIADFYLANPPLLHRTHMTKPVRDKFNALRIQRPEKTFVSYPSAPILFQKMSEVQRQAIRTITGKGLLDIEQLEKGVVVPSRTGRPLFEASFAETLGDQERRLAKFIVNDFADGGNDIATLRRSTGLRRVA